MNILIGADFLPTRRNAEYFVKGDIRHLFGEQLTGLLTNSDCRIFNLEIPLTDKESPISKCGPNLIAPTECIAGYRAAGVDLLTLANNHIMDQGQQGLESTLQLLRENDIHAVGAGKTPEEAAKPFIFSCDGKSIGVYACVEHEFSVVTGSSAGANPIDLLESPDHIAALKAQCDYVIVLYHGGKEYYRYPSPNLQRVCRKLVEKGADLVLCQHSHCIGCEEKYRDGTIVYGQGNFLFDEADNEFWQTGLLVKIGDNFEISYLPLVKAGNGVRLAEENRGREILDGFRKRSEEIRQPDFVRVRYGEFADSFFPKYMNIFKGKESLLYKVLNKLSRKALRKWSLRRKYGTAQLFSLWNCVDCEAHRELLLRGIQEKAKK